MGDFFGTDGIRGIVNKNLNFDIAFNCGNALGQMKSSAKILIGTDTRKSGDYLKTALVSGAVCAGADVCDVGIITTPGVSYLTKLLGYDYGVMITASHNPPEYNGIKIFDEEGLKLGEARENNLENLFKSTKKEDYKNLGNFKQKFNLSSRYEDFLIKSCKTSLKGLKIVLDLSNGASCRLAPKVFKRLGANVRVLNAKHDGVSINKNCGALFVEGLKNEVLRLRADAGFAYDGDADRIIAIDEKGNILNGDSILWVLARYWCKTDKVVITSNSNLALDEELLKINIKTVRTDVGDKFVLEKMIEDDISLGGEQSGHIILKELMSGGDGILASIQLASILVKTKARLSSLAKIDFYPQLCADIIVKNKHTVMKMVQATLVEEQEKIKGKGRIVLRASGTEEKIRILVESKDEKKAKDAIQKLSKAVLNAGELCVE